MTGVRRALRRIVTVGWRCWICQTEVDDYLTSCPVQH
jgi:hypothetical protein